jgi:long-subunit fatty acid transport protein
MIFGVGMNYRFSEHFGMRAEYRGLFYKSPTLPFPKTAPVTRLFTITNEPAISLTYTFSRHRTNGK